MNPSPSRREQERLQALANYDILDTPPEEPFDRLTRLAARLFDVPLALVTLLDPKRQWAKSCYGTGIREIPREHSFCTHAIQSDDVTVVRDATEDPRFAQNPFVTGEPHIRFYAGAPLRTPKDYLLGTLCILDYAPRRLTEQETNVLTDLAAIAVDELELRRDISRRKQTEEMLRDARRHAEETLRLKTALLNNMSHEVRTPLTSILGFADVLTEAPDDETREFAGLIKRSGRRLLSTLDSVLDLARLKANQLHLHPEPLDVAAEVRESLRLMEPLAHEKNLPLTAEGAEDPLPAHVDAFALNRVLTNLLSNAIKFTESGSVTVSVASSPECIRLQVRDTGKGMSEAFLDELFEEFTQESAGLSRSHEGNGLGLAITCRLVRLMDGRLEVKSEEGAGTTFTVSLPRRLEHVHDPPADRANDRAA